VKIPFMPLARVNLNGQSLTRPSVGKTGVFVDFLHFRIAIASDNASPGQPMISPQFICRRV
jgi:hypothetical protein